MKCTAVILLFGFLLPADALSSGRTLGTPNFMVREEVGQELVFIHDPKPTKFDDLTNDPPTIPELYGKAPTPVELAAWPVTMMTGNDRLSTSIQESQRFEEGFVKTMIEHWKNYSEKGSFLDAGANLGAFTLPLAFALRAHPQRTMIAVEALPLNRKLLRASLKANNFSNVHLYEYAVGNWTWDDSTQFSSSALNSGHAHVTKLGPPSGFSRFRVPVTTFDAIYRQDPEPMKNIFGMKMDMEESEPYALDGGSTWLREHPPCWLMVELNKGPKSNTLLVETIQKYGYVIWKKGQLARNKVFVQKDMQKCVDRLDRAHL